MKNNLTLAIASVLLPLALLIVSIVTNNATIEKWTSVLLGITTIMLVNGVRIIYRYFYKSTDTNNYEK